MSIAAILVKEGIGLFKFRRLNQFIQKWTALAVGISFCFVTALLVDFEKHWTGMFTGMLAAAALIIALVKHLRQGSARRARERQAALKAELRAQAVRAFTENIETTAAEAATTISSGTATVLNVVKDGFVGAVAHGSDTVEKAKVSMAEVAKEVSNGLAGLADITSMGINGIHEKLRSCVATAAPDTAERRSRAD